MLRRGTSESRKMSSSLLASGALATPPNELGVYTKRTWSSCLRACALVRVREQGAAKAEPTVLAIGVEGGFLTDEQKWDVVKTHRLVVLKSGQTEGFSVAYPDQVIQAAGPKPASFIPNFVSFKLCPLLYRELACWHHRCTNPSVDTSTWPLLPNVLTACDTGDRHITTVLHILLMFLT